ncbi:MAG: hypothetical protein HOC74_05215 [Gemmatimonadetes bacterium]|nr:hypothetical protein [Gemmatimonadota bacterium]
MSLVLLVSTLHSQDFGARLGTVKFVESVSSAEPVFQKIVPEFLWFYD